jgi:hypothetical protein
MSKANYLSGSTKKNKTNSLKPTAQIITPTTKSLLSNAIALLATLPGVAGRKMAQRPTNPHHRRSMLTSKTWLSPKIQSGCSQAVVI